MALVRLLVLLVISAAAYAQLGTLPFSGASTNSGWTVFTPTGGTCGVGNATCIYYVDNTGGQGNDSTCAGQSPPVTTTPAAGTQCATIAKALTLLRAAKPDWLLLKAGNTWTEGSNGLGSVSGLSASAPILISSYGTGARPVIKSGSNAGLNVVGSFSRDNIAIVGLNFYASARDPTSGDYTGTAGDTGLSVASNLSNWTIEDCVFQFYIDNIAIDATTFTATNVKINRNVITDSYSVSSHSEGVYVANVVGLTLYENLYDHNGWNSTLIASQTCTITIASPAAVTCAGLATLKIANKSQIILATTGALPTGLAANTAYCVNNLSGSTFNVALPDGSTGCNPSGANINTSGSQSGTQSAQWIDAAANVFNRNVYLACTTTGVTATGNISSNSAAEGAEWRTGGTITNNLSVQSSDGFDVGHLEECSVATSASVTQNVILNSVDIQALPVSAGNGRGTGIVGYRLNTAGVQITNNIIAHVSSASGNVAGLNFDSTVTNIVAINNIICDWANPITDAGSGNTTTPNQSKAANCNAGGWTGSQPSLVDPNRTVGGYYASIGNPGGFGSTTAGFLSAARLQSKTNWNAALTADQGVNPYIRAGFGL